MFAWEPVRPEPKQYVAAGDPLRAVGALAVLTYHVLYTALKAHGLHLGFAAFGSAGVLIYGMELAVPMFFTLSAYLIGRPWIHALILGEPLPKVTRYTGSRVRRIVPIFWFFGAASALRYGMGPFPHWLDLPALFGFAQTYHNSWAAGGIQQGWTIDVEVAFYILLPLILWAMLPLARRVAPTLRVAGLLALFSGGMLVSIYLRAHGPGGVDASLRWLASPPAMFFSFAPGLMLATVEVPLRPWITGHPRSTRVFEYALWVVAVLALLVYSVTGPTVGAPALLQDARGKRVLFEILSPAALVAALLVRQWRDAGCPRLLNNAPLQWLGARTLSFYLAHMIVLIELTRAVAPQDSLWGTVAVWGAIALVVTTTIAAITYRLIEEPFLQRRVRIPERARIWRPRPLAAEPVSGSTAPRA